MREKSKTKNKMNKTINNTLTKKNKSKSITSTSFIKNIDIRKSMIATEPSKILVRAKANYNYIEEENSKLKLNDYSPGINIYPRRYINLQEF